MKLHPYGTEPIHWVTGLSIDQSSLETRNIEKYEKIQTDDDDDYNCNKELPKHYLQK